MMANRVISAVYGRRFQEVSSRIAVESRPLRESTWYSSQIEKVINDVFRGKIEKEN